MIIYSKSAKVTSKQCSGTTSKSKFCLISGPCDVIKIVVVEQHQLIETEIFETNNKTE